MTLSEFRRSYYQRRPLARDCNATLAVRACGWDQVDTLLDAPAEHILVISRGVLTEDPAPRSLTSLRALFKRGVGVLVKHADSQLASLDALCRAFAQAIPGMQRVYVFATPRGTHGFGWHYDAEDVFILQTAGEKTYYLRANTQEPALRPGARPDFSTFHRETSPTASCTLRPGNLLYVPRGTWHVAQPLDDSLSVSIGIAAW